MVMIKIPPKIVLPAFGLTPVPGFLNGYVWSIHVGNIVPVSELGEFSAGSEGGLAHFVAHCVASDVDASHWVGDSEDATSPPLVEGLVRVTVGGEIRIIVIEGSIKYFGVDDAKDGVFLSARGVSELGVAAVTRHPADEAVLLGGPDGGLEC